MLSKAFFLDDFKAGSELAIPDDVVLVDHNVINAPELKILEQKVSFVFDHRPRERPCNADEEVHIENVGSCATLITEQIFSVNSNFHDEDALQLLRYLTYEIVLN